MLFLFGDESGDITINRGKRYFIYVGVLAESKKKCEESLRKLAGRRYEEQFHRKFKKEVHASNLDEDEIMFFLNGLADFGYKIYYSFVDTYDIGKELNKEKNPNIRKAKVLELVIVNSFLQYNTLREIIIDKGGISDEVRKQLEADLEKNLKRKFKIQPVASHKSAGVQIADLVSWAVKEKIEGNSTAFYDVIKEKILGYSEL